MAIFEKFGNNNDLNSLLRNYTCGKSIHKKGSVAGPLKQIFVKNREKDTELYVKKKDFVLSRSLGCEVKFRKKTYSCFFLDFAKFNLNFLQITVIFEVIASQW